MALFGGPSMEKILAKGSPAAGRITGIRVRYVSDGESDRRVDEYAVEHAGGTAGVRQILSPDDLVRLGMEVDLVVLGDAAVIDWAATGRRLGFEGTVEPHRYKALKEPTEPGITDEEKALASVRKKGEPATIEITGLDEQPFLGGLATRLIATVTVTLPGTEPYQAEIKGLTVPFYAGHLARIGLVAPGFVALKRLDKPAIDWAAAANADPGVGQPSVRSRPPASPDDAMGAADDDLDETAIRASIDAAGTDGPVHGGVDLATYVSIEVGLQRDRVDPAEHDAFALGKGMPASTTWAAASAAWQAAMRDDWRLGAAFGEAFEAERRRR